MGIESLPNFSPPAPQCWESIPADIRQRIGGEIIPEHVKRALQELIERGAVRFEGDTRWRCCWLAQPLRHLPALPSNKSRINLKHSPCWRLPNE